jgi:hypothetical protein
MTIERTTISAARAKTMGMFYDSRSYTGEAFAKNQLDKKSAVT